MARKLADDCGKEKIPCNRRPIHGLQDVASKADCEVYLRAIAQTITELQQQSSDTEVHVLLSGGRKSMATLNLFAAQRAGLSLVWHTLVKDHKLEQRLEEELRQALSPTRRRDILFLRQYPPENFDLFAVPVFPIA
jgi:CRISPR-associated protein (TIGR02584 family)